MRSNVFRNRTSLFNRFLRFNLYPYKVCGSRISIHRSFPSMFPTQGFFVAQLFGAEYLAGQALANLEAKGVKRTSLEISQPHSFKQSRTVPQLSSAEPRGQRDPKNMGKPWWLFSSHLRKICTWYSPTTIIDKHIQENVLNYIAKG